MQLKKNHAWLALPVLSLVGSAVWFLMLQTPPPQPALDPASAAPPGVASAAFVGPPAPPKLPLAPLPFRTAEVRVVKGSSLSKTLQDLGLESKDRLALMESMKPVLNPAHIAAGTALKAYYQGAEDTVPSKIDVTLSETKLLLIERHGENQWTTAEKEKAVERRMAAYSGVVTSSLWNSATAAGMDPQLISQLASIFAWQVDFNREVREDDKWRLTVERLYVEGQPIGYGDIVAAEYNNAGSLYTAVRYVEDGITQYFAPDGGSLRRMFLKGPLKYGHITSGFSARRFHPILKINKPHLGIDYGAPPGTPVLAVGDGTVTFASYHGDSGKMIALRHNSVYQTQYKHLSGFARGINSGAKVRMGQVIGYVGSTGLATGPHLHFEFHVNGSVVDPQGLKFPAADPVPQAQLAEFHKAAERTIAELPPWSSGVLTQKTSE